MSTAHKPDVLHRHPTNKAREALAVVLGVPAVGLTLFAVVNAWFFIFDDWIGGEVMVMQLGLLVTGFLALLAWTGVVALHKSARREVDDAWRRGTTAAVWVALGAAAVAAMGVSGWTLVGAAVIAVLSSVVAFVASLRM